MMETPLPRGVYRKTDTGIYYFQPSQVKGLRPSPISLQTKSRNEARKRCLQLVGNRGRGTNTNAEFEIERFLALKARDRAHTSSTQRNAKSALYLFRKNVGNHPVDAYTQGQIEGWRESLRAGGATETTVRTYLTWLGVWFRWLKAEGLLEVDPTEEVVIPKGKRTRAQRYCTKDEREMFLRESLAYSPDAAFLVWSGAFLGMRLLEMIEARAEWFDLSAGVVHVQQTATFQPKDKEVRAIPMSSRYREFLAWYGQRKPFMLRPDKAHGKWKYRVEPKRWLAEMRADCGMDWVNWHTLRHTYATLHVMAGTPLALVAKWLGDDEKTTFDHYFGYVRSHGHQDAAD